MSTYVVTGGGGFIGSNIVRHLVEIGEEVRVIDDFSTGRRSNLEGIDDDITLFEGDLCDPEILNQAFQRADYVLHQGAVPSVQRSVEDPVTSDRVNVGGTLKVLDAARKASVKRVVYASSSSVYGDKPTLPKQEDMPPEPMSPYAASKLAGEYYCSVYSATFDLPTVSLRYFNVFGPRQDPKSDYAAVIPIFTRCAIQGKQATVFGDGEQSRDFTYVDNVVQANLRAARADTDGAVICNVGTGSRYTLNTLLEMLGELTGGKVERTYDDPRPGDVRHSEADITRAREHLGYEPSVSFEEGLELTLEWYRKQLG